MLPDLPQKKELFVVGAKYTHKHFTNVYMRVNVVERASPSSVKLSLSFFSTKDHHQTMNDCWIEVDESMAGLWGRLGDS